MPGKTKIEWATDTWNPVTGCTKVSQGCKNCYAERDWVRLSANPKTVYYGRKFTDVQCHPERLDQPLRWKKPRRIFVNSMSDLFHEDVPDAFIQEVFAVMASADKHIFQILTKRPDRMRDFMANNMNAAMVEGVAQRRYFEKTGEDPSMWLAVNFPLTNVWLGISVEDQETADERIPLLLQTPAAVRWLSIEPLLNSIRLDNASNLGPGFNSYFCGLDWVVVGGESGPKARPTHPDWVRSLRDQCLAANVPYFFKQWGAWAPVDLKTARGVTDWMIVDQDGGIDIPDHRTPLKEAGEVAMRRAGKKAAGRLLDGYEWNGVPE